MQWQEINDKFEIYKSEFIRIHKCINVKRKVSSETLNPHVDKIIDTYEKLNKFIIQIHKQITVEEFNYLKSDAYKLRDKLIVSFEKQSVKIMIPLGIVSTVLRSITTSDSDNSDYYIVTQKTRCYYQLLNS